MPDPAAGSDAARDQGQRPARGQIVAESIAKRYQTPAHEIEVLRDLSFEIAAGGQLAILGPSGSGKSTLLHILGALEQPSSGRVTIDGFDPAGASEKELAGFRNQQVGFVFQDHHLLGQFSVLQNVLLPTLASGAASGAASRAGSAVDRASRLLERVGLGDRREHRPSELSGGERQRAAIARALINRPAALLCDEPTGNLDRKTADSVADLLFELHQEERSSLVAVTHSEQLARRFSQQMTLN